MHGMCATHRTPGAGATHTAHTTQATHGIHSRHDRHDRHDRQNSQNSQNSREQPRTAAGGFVRFGHAGASRRPQVWVGGLLGARAARAGSVHLGLVAWALARKPLLLGHPLLVQFMEATVMTTALEIRNEFLEQRRPMFEVVGPWDHVFI